MHRKLSTAQLSAFLAQVPPRQRKIVATLRRLIRRAAPDAAVTILWKSLSYHRPRIGGRVKGAVCLITPQPECVHLGFIHGAALADPAHLLRGSARVKRVVPIRLVSDIDVRKLSRLVAAAGEYVPGQAAAPARPSTCR